MSESALSFEGSSLFRKQLLVKNLPPYNVVGAYTPPEPAIDYETNLTVANVTDSNNQLVSTNVFAENLYPLNEYGPEGGYGQPIGINSIASTNNPEGTNQGPYEPNDTVLDIVNEFYIEAAYVKNIWGPSGGYKDLVIITDVQLPNQYFSPYFTEQYWNWSFYTTYSIVFQDNPVGTNGPLSEDSPMMKLGAAQLKSLFKDRIDQEIASNTIGLINLDTITDPFTASLIATGQQPLFEKNWKITVPENVGLAAVSLANRLTGTYFPVSFIPGDYFDEVNPYTNPGQTSNALNVANNLTGGLLSPILNKSRNPSEIFVANTGGGTRSILFASLDYNRYRPSYNTGLIQGISAFFGNLVNQNQPASGGYYVGSKDAEPSLIDSPPNQVPVNEFGEQQATIVYGPQELGILYEGNIGRLQFGLAGKSYSDDGGITGQLVWTSPKYKPNTAWKVGKGGDPKFVDQEFNEIQADYNRYQSTDIDFKPGSILDNTQRLVDSADQVQGATRLKHVGNAINQVSKVFNDGYKEITKGSQVMSYTDQTTGQEAGIEYCRVFTKDTPYFTYADLQKTDGITNAGRKFTYSIFDNTYNLNIAPLRNPGSTNIVEGKVKKYMFSIENLAWRTSDRPGYTYDDLPVCEKGPNGGRIMWFPPYNLKFSDDSKPSFNETNFLGRPEPIYTYRNTSRSGSLNWTIIVDNPSMLNTIIEKQLKGVAKERVDSIVDSFFAGCTKYDIYDLGIKFNQIPTRDLYIYQQVLNNPRLTTEEYAQVLDSVWTNSEGSLVEGNALNVDGLGTATGGSALTVKENENNYADELKKYEGYGFYFHNDLPDPSTNLVQATQPFDFWYNQYIGLKSTDYVTKSPDVVYLTANDEFDKGGIPNFFNSVVEGNYTTIQTKLLPILDKIIVEKKGTVKMKLVGSASAPNTEEYNVNLSERRLSSVIQWFDKQPTSDGKTFGQYRTGGNPQLFFTTEGEGEEISIPVGSTIDTENVGIFGTNSESVLETEVDCTVDIKQKINNSLVTTKAAQVYSVPAMACRRVVMRDMVIEIPPDDGEEIDIIEQNNEVDLITVVDQPYTGLTRTIKPEAEVNIEAKIKEGISKKILRNLFTECDYFEIIKESNPMVYDSFRDKIKYFNPAFHSMTPEGLNARLTFLQQCMRPGQTIPVIGPDGRPKYNDALNTSFGAPPVLVLRVGDFYNTKIIPTNLSISYEPLHLDLNPEGIGVQPMLANISLGFNIIGGMGLKEPVQELQNALSFNFYANTEIYDERATSTDKESTEKNDKYVISKLNLNQPTVPSQAANTQQPKKGQSTIGTLSGSSLDYQGLFTELDANIKSYVDASFNYMSSLQQQTNMGILQLTNNGTNYSNGQLAQLTTPKETKIYGKPSNPSELINNLVNLVVSDVNKREDPIMFALKKNPANFKNKTLREVEEKLKTQVSSRNDEISNSVNQLINTFVENQQNLNYVFRKMDLVLDKLDGVLMSSNNPTIYDLSGDTFFGAVSSNESVNYLYLSDDEPSAQVASAYKIISIFNAWNDKKLNRPATYDKTKGTINWDGTNKGVSVVFPNEEENRFYLVMSQIFTDDVRKEKLFTELTNGEEVKSEKDIIPVIRAIIDNLSKTFKKEFDGEKDYFNTQKDSEELITIKNYVLPSIKSSVSYVTPPTDNVEQKTTKVKNLYSTQNLNTDTTFNGKVTFN